MKKLNLDQKREIIEATRQRFIDVGFVCSKVECFKYVFTFYYSKNMIDVKILGSIILE